MCLEITQKRPILELWRISALGILEKNEGNSIFLERLVIFYVKVRNKMEISELEESQFNKVEETTDEKI